MVFASPIRPLAVISDSCAACALLAASDWEDCALPAAAAAFALSWLATVSDAFAAAAEAAADCTLSSIVPIRSSTPCAARVTSSHAATVSEDWSRVLGSTSASPEYSTDSLSGTSTYRTIPPATSSDALHAHWVVEGITSAVASPAVSLTVCATGRRIASATVTRLVGTRLTLPSRPRPSASVRWKCTNVMSAPSL